MNPGAASCPDAALGTATLVRRGPVARDRYVLDFDVSGGPVTGTMPAPGQFYLIDCGGGREHLLRRPMSVHGAPRWGDGGAMLRFLVERVGWGTGRLCSLEPGEKVSVLGPLGTGFTFPDAGGALLVAGGMGVAPLFFLASRMDERGLEYDFVAGFRTAEDCYPWMGELGGAVRVFTEDGSAGEKGTASDGARERLSKGAPPAVFACGPDAMMAAVAEAAERSGTPCQVSLASRMACGLGACRGCVRPGRDGRTLCVCTEGPVFDSEMVHW